MEEECNIMELVSQLKQEKLLITSEKNEIKCLHEKVFTYKHLLFNRAIQCDFIFSWDVVSMNLLKPFG